MCFLVGWILLLFVLVFVVVYIWSLLLLFANALAGLYQKLSRSPPRANLLRLVSLITTLLSLLEKRAWRRRNPSCLLNPSKQERQVRSVGWLRYFQTSARPGLCWPAKLAPPVTGSLTPLTPKPSSRPPAYLPSCLLACIATQTLLYMRHREIEPWLDVMSKSPSTKQLEIFVFQRWNLQSQRSPT